MAENKDIIKLSSLIVDNQPINETNFVPDTVELSNEVSNYKPIKISDFKKTIIVVDEIQENGNYQPETCQNAYDPNKVSMYVDQQKNETLMSNYYTIEEIEEILSGKTNIDSVYTKDETYNKNEVYNVSQIDFLLKLKANKVDVYSKIDINTLLDVKANKNEVYDKNEIDEILNSYYTKLDIDTILENKADTEDVIAISGQVLTNIEDIGYLKTNKANVSDLLSVSGQVSANTEDISNLQSNKADKATTLSGYGITDTPSDNKTYGRKNGDWEEIDSFSIISLTYTALKNLRNSGQLVPGQSYRITDYMCTTITANSRSANKRFDIIVTALDEGILSESANAIKRDGDTYFTNTKVEAWELKYCIDNDTNRFAWADSVNGKGVIYYMKDEWGNECPYDFKNIQYLKNSVWVYTFGGTVDNSLSVACFNNIINLYISSNKQTLNNITFGNDCRSNTFGRSCYSNTFGNNCYFNTFGDNCYSNTFGDWCYSNTFDNGCRSNTFGDYGAQNTFGGSCYLNTFGNNFGRNTFGISCQSNTFGINCYSNTFGDNYHYNTFGNYCNSNTFGDDCKSNTFGDICSSNTFGNKCESNNFYHGLSGTTKKNYIRYIVLKDGVSRNNFYSNLTTSSTSFLQRIRIKGLENTTTTNTTITLPDTNTKYEWFICYTSGNVLKQYCPND